MLYAYAFGIVVKASDSQQLLRKTMLLRNMVFLRNLCD